MSSEDLEEPLMSSHLLTGHRIPSLPDGTATIGSDGDEDFKVISQELT